MTEGPYGAEPYPQDPAGGYPAAGYEGGSYATPGYPAPGQPAPGYAAPGYPAPSYPAPGQPAPGYAAPGYPGQQPAFGPGPLAYGMSAAPRNGLGTAALVLGIIGVVLSWIPGTGWALNILAIIFGAVGINRAKRGQATNKSSALAGLILGVIGLTVWIVILVVFLAAWGSYSSYYH